MSRALALIYGLVCYAVFFATFLYLIGFVGNLAVPRSVDSGTPATLATALSINALLLALFGMQHSVMARPWFKRWWTRLVPWPVERSTYVLIASLLLALLCWQWRTPPGTVWEVTGAIGAGVLWGLFGLGWALVLLSTMLINHFDLFGLRQVWSYARGKAYEPIGFKSPWLYQVVRHPLMLGFLVAFWATPRMTVSHLIFALGNTVYILIAIQVEERDLGGMFGDRYQEYRRRVRALVPIPRRGQQRA